MAFDLMTVSCYESIKWNTKSEWFSMPYSLNCFLAWHIPSQLSESKKNTPVLWLLPIVGWWWWWWWGWNSTCKTLLLYGVHILFIQLLIPHWARLSPALISCQFMPVKLKSVACDHFKKAFKWLILRPFIINGTLPCVAKCVVYLIRFQLYVKSRWIEVLFDFSPRPHAN